MRSRRTGREGIYTRVVQDKRQKLRDIQISDPSDWPEMTHVHRLFDCPNPVTYCDGSAAYCACEDTEHPSSLV